MINGELIDLVAGDYEARIASSGAMLVHLRHQGRDLIMPFDACLLYTSDAADDCSIV